MLSFRLAVPESNVWTDDVLEPSHQGVTHISLGSLALCRLLSVWWWLGVVMLRGGLGQVCIFFGELRVSAVWILQAVAEGINRLSLPPHTPTLSSGMGLFTEAVL